MFKRNHFLSGIAALFFAGFHTTALPCSICRCGDSAFFINSARSLNRGQWIFTVENFYTRKTSGIVIDHHDERAGRMNRFSPLGVQHVLHGSAGEESQRQNNLQFILNYGISGRLQLMAAVPYSFNRLSSAEESINSNGFGDPEVILIAHLGSLFGNRVRLAASSGIRLPLGSTNAKNDAGAVLDQHAQNGTGAWAGTWGMQAAFGPATLPLFVSASYQLNGINDRDFRYGNVWRYNFAAQRALSRSIDLIGEVNGRYARRDRADGVRDPNSGGTVIYFSPGVRLNIAGNLALRVQSQFPIAENLYGVQHEKTNFRAGVIWTM